MKKTKHTKRRKKAKGYVNIICILDRSGSMQSIIHDAIGGYNKFLTGQQQIPGRALLTNLLFDTEFIWSADHLDLQAVPCFTPETYVPRGGTSLYDAIGTTIDRELDRLGSLPAAQHPTKTLCVILTDGEENSSREYHREQIQRMIGEMREEMRWEFIFLAANQDALLTADSIGVSRGNTLNFAATKEGVENAYTNINHATTLYRTSTADASNLFADSNS